MRTSDAGWGLPHKATSMSHAGHVSGGIPAVHPDLEPVNGINHCLGSTHPEAVLFSRHVMEEFGGVDAARADFAGYLTAFSAFLDEHLLAARKVRFDDLNEHTYVPERRPVQKLDTRPLATTCPCCGRAYVRASMKQVYCSEACQKRYRRQGGPDQVRYCLSCGERIVPKRYITATKWCSRRCKRRATGY